MTTGEAGTPILQKLGVKRGQTALLIGVPEAVAELDLYADFAERVDVPSLVARELDAALACGPFDYIHVFETDADLLEAELAKIKDALVADGMIWISWPKQSSRVETSLTEDVIRELALPTGLVDVKVCAVDDVWSALKFVIRLIHRPPTLPGAAPI